MAEEAVEKSEKESPLDAFRKKLGDKENLKNAIMEGLKSTNAKVRSLAVKAAFRLKDHALVKNNVLPLIKSDKSKKVLRTVSEKITRKDLAAKVKKMVAAPKAAKKDDAAAPAEAAPAAAPKA